MEQVDVINSKGEVVNKFPLNSAVKGEVSGGGIKPWRQKGTGRARSGSIRNPHFRGGGVAFGPQGVENYSLDINKKLKKKVLQSLLGEKMRKKELIVIDKLVLENYKTQEAEKFLNILPIKKTKTLIVLANQEENKEKIIRSFRNLPYLNISDKKELPPIIEKGYQQACYYFEIIPVKQVVFKGFFKEHFATALRKLEQTKSEYSLKIIMKLVELVAHEISHAVLFNIDIWRATKNQKIENNKNVGNYYELITFYNRLDKQQKEEFRHYLEQMRGEKIIPSQVENHLINLNQDNYAELIVQAKLLLITMSEKIIKCAKCQNNAETKNRCGKSVANIKFPASGQPTYPHCYGGVSYGCERISNKEERQHSRFIKLLPPGEKGICDRYTLTKEQKLAEVIRTGGVRMAEFYGKNLTADQLADQKEAPRSIYEDFVHNQKCGTCGEEPCHLEKKSKSNSGHSLSVSSSDNETKKEELEKKLVEAKRQGVDKKEIERLQSELQKLNNQQKEEVKPAKNNKKINDKNMLIQKPVLTEKGQLLYQKNKIYAFYVLPSANKFQIKQELEKMFQVKIKKVRTSRQKPVLRQTRYLQKSPTRIYTKLRKKAFVELMPGQKLP
ncbi:25447_t:CDS:10, partial [Gigaspora margarita]